MYFSVNLHAWGETLTRYRPIQVQLSATPGTGIVQEWRPANTLSEAVQAVHDYIDRYRLDAHSFDGGNVRDARTGHIIAVVMWTGDVWYATHGGRQNNLSLSACEMLPAE